MLRRNAVLSWLARQQHAELRKGMLLPLMLTIPTRAADPGLAAFVKSMQRLWSLAVRLQTGDASADLEWQRDGELDDPQRKLLKLFEQMEAAGLMELAEDELAES